jgi:DNA polymerase-4
MPRAILHVDLDAFYASVEQRDDPSLSGQPVIVGGHATRGVVLAASYEARPFGVRSAMPMSTALKRAPHARVVSPRMDAYVEASEQVFRILESFTPLCEPLSLDEAFLDVTASTSLFGTPWDMALAIRNQIAEKLNLPASAGIAAVKSVAKVVSDLAKPNGQREVKAEETPSFLARLPVGKLWGVGPKTEQTLAALGLRTMGDVAAQDVQWLERNLGVLGPQLWLLSRGEDDRDVIPDRQAKSIGAEDTFGEDLRGTDALLPNIHAQALRVGRRMRRAGLRCRAVQLKIKYSDFRLLTRRKALAVPTDDGQTLFEATRRMLESEVLEKAVRLTGVSAQELLTGGQIPLFDGAARKRARLNSAMDALQERFGRAVVTTADVAAAQDENDAPDLRARQRR